MDDLSGQVEQLMALREKNLTDLTALEDKHKKISLEVVCLAFVLSPARPDYGQHRKPRPTLSILRP